MTQSYADFGFFSGQPLTRFQIESRLVAFRSVMDRYETGENDLTFEGYTVLVDAINQLEADLIKLD